MCRLPSPRPPGPGNNSLTLNELVQSVRFTGGIGTVGVYVPEDPGGPEDLAKHGKTRFDFGEFWFKGQAMSTGQCPVKRYNRYLRSLIHEDKAKPSWIVSHDLSLDQHSKPTSTSTPAKKAGPKSSCTRTRRGDFDKDPSSGGIWVNAASGAAPSAKTRCHFIWPRRCCSAARYRCDQAGHAR